MSYSDVVIAAGSVLMIAFLYYYLYRQYREKYVKLWSISWLFSFVGVIAYFLNTVPTWQLPATILVQLAFLLSGAFLVQGLHLFLHQKNFPGLRYICISIGIWVIVGAFYRIPFTLYYVLSYCFVGALYLHCAAALFNVRRRFGFAAYIVMIAFISWGIHLFNYPFIGKNLALSKWGFPITSIFTVAMAISILLIYFRKVRLDLHASEERYRLLAQNAHDIIYRIQLKPELKFDFISPALLKLTGYSPEELYQNPKKIKKAVHPDYLPALLEILHGQWDFDKPNTLAWIHKNGQIIWLEQRIHSETDADGNIILIGIARDVSERLDMEAKLKALSTRDALTGLYNRAYFEQAYQRYASDDYNPLGLILCDIDGLKVINDTLGHEAGDTLLLAAAAVIKQSFRDNDIIARIGGDEFAVILPQTKVAVNEKAVQRIQKAIAKYNHSSSTLQLSMSVGFAIRDDSSLSLTDLFKTADDNMYRSKLYRNLSFRSTVVNILSKALEARDFITEGHAERLQTLILELAQVVGFARGKMTDLKLLAQFHDIGKVGIPDRVLFKPGRLTDEERTEMQRHAEIGFRIAQSSPDLLPIAEWILKHHEWWDGTGYPMKLKGEEIPLECRILAIVDAFDAMTNDRPYRQALSFEEALAELHKGRGSQFDPSLTDKFIALVRKLNPDPAT